jgi:hypothetical protein
VNRDQLEATIWQQLATMMLQKITQGGFVDAVLAAADRYAIDVSGEAAGDVFAERRAVLVVDGAPRKPKADTWRLGSDGWYWPAGYLPQERL